MGSGNSKTAPPVSAPPVPHHFVLTTSANQNQKASAQGCRFFLEGRCRFGDSCNHPHVARKTESQRVSTVDYHNSLTTHSSPQSTEQHNSLHTPENRPARTAQAPSATPLGFLVDGRILGPFATDANTQNSQMFEQPNKSTGPPVSSVQLGKRPQPADASSSSEVGSSAISDCHAWRAGNCSRDRECRFAHDPEVQSAEPIGLTALEEEEALRTIDQIVLSSTKVTFAAGASVVEVATGFKSCLVMVKNLPLAATNNEVVNFFTQPGFDRSRFVVMGLRQLADHQDATVVFDDIEDAKMAVLGLDGIEFGDRTLKLEMSSKEEELGASKGDPNVLTITWPAPSASAVLTYTSLELAQEKIREFDGALCCGRRVRVEMKRRSPKFPGAFFNPASVKISGLPADITAEIIQELFNALKLKHLKSGPYDLPTGINKLHAFVQGFGPSSFEPQSWVSEAGISTAKVRFDGWDQAKRAYDRLENSSMHFLGDSKCYVSFHGSLHYSKFIPPEQFNVQAPIFQSIVDGSRKDLNARAHVQYFPGQDGKFARVEVSGCDKKAFGSLKVRVEQLVAGEKLEYWDRFFCSREGEVFLVSVSNRTQAYVRRDGCAQVLKAFGEPRAIEGAKAMIKAEMERLSLLEFTIPLQRNSIRFFVNQGVAMLKEFVGDENVRLDIVACTITIRGGEDARHTLDNLVDQSLAPTSAPLHNSATSGACPVCFDDVDNPFRLPCGHIYCTGCLRHFLTTACETKQFPLVCMGNDATCAQPLPIPIVQKFLPPTQINRLFEVAFQDHLARHPNEYKYCTTLDCPQIYRLEKGLEVVHCQTCFASACVSCDQDHEGFTCVEWKAHRDPAEQQRLLMGWAEGNTNVKKCPSCRTFIEKSGGCNHMECGKCKTHICWVCMGTFESGAIYGHMSAAHGGYGIF